MYQPSNLAEPAGSVALDLATHAWNRRLTIYAGAGVSAAPPTSLPGATALARLVVDALETQIDLRGVERDDLGAVADAVADHPLGGDLLRQTILNVADLRGAAVNYAHEVLGLMLCEGVATVFETNYDDCIERGAQPEHPTVVRTAVELLSSNGSTLLKVHGCATRPETILVTAADLANAPSWAQMRVAAHLAVDRVAFVGIGSPADYVRRSVEELLDGVGAQHLLLVDPQLKTWDEDPPSPWREVLPELEPERMDTRSAEEFCDALMRAYLAHPRQGARDAVKGLPEEHLQRLALETLIRAIEKRDGVWVLRWLRAASYRLPTGDSVAMSSQAVAALLSLSALLGDGRLMRLARGGWCFFEFEPLELTQDAPGPVLLAGTPPETPEVSNNAVPADWGVVQEGAARVPVMVLIVHGATTGVLAQDEARQRVIRAREEGLIAVGEPVVVVVVRHMGPMSSEVAVARGDRLADVVARVSGAADSAPDDLIATAVPNHLIDGVRAGTIVLVTGDDLIEAA